jgi:membrane protein required for colicin V production
VLADIVIIVLLILFGLIGFFRGALRQLIALGAWLVAFVLAAQGRGLLGDWMRAQEPDFSVEYSNMLGFLVTFLILLLAALAVIELSGRTVTLSSRVIVDEFVGGAALLLFGVLALSGVLFVLDTYYAVPPAGFTAEVDLVRQLHTALGESRIATALHDTLVPLVQELLGPLLPPDVRDFG